MNLKTTALLALLVPSLAMLAGCNPDTDDTTMTPDAAPAATTPPMDTTPADTMPSDPMPAGTMGATSGMAGDDMPFAEMDANQDGGISMDELTPADMLHQHFSVADADGNGMLSEAEVTQHRADMAADPAS